MLSFLILYQLQVIWQILWLNRDMAKQEVRISSDLVLIYHSDYVYQDAKGVSLERFRYSNEIIGDSWNSPLDLLLRWLVCVDLMLLS
jgi:hypothetical protein